MAVENGQANSGVDPLIKPFVDFWSGYMKEANDSTRELLEGISSSADAKTWQRRWFDAVSKSMDAYLRSPVFLQAMKQNTDMLVKAKRQADDFTAEVARNSNIPTAQDISGLFERLHSIEDVILRRLAHIDKRLTAIEEHTGIGQPVNP